MKPKQQLTMYKNSLQVGRHLGLQQRRSWKKSRNKSSRKRTKCPGVEQLYSPGRLLMGRSRSPHRRHGQNARLKIRRDFVRILGPSRAGMGLMWFLLWFQADVLTLVKKKHCIWANFLQSLGIRICCCCGKKFTIWGGTPPHPIYEQIGIMMIILAIVNIKSHAILIWDKLIIMLCRPGVDFLQLELNWFANFGFVFVDQRT